jgi:PKD repeat protein
MLPIKSFALLLILLTPLIAIPSTLVRAQYPDYLGITLMSDKSAYYLGQPINIFGNLTQYGEPVANGTVAVAVYDPSGKPIVFRTVKTGPASPPTSLVDFVELTPCDQTGAAQSSFLLQQSLYVAVTIHNYDVLSHDVFTTITVFDANGVVLGAIPISSNMLSQGSSFSFLSQCPDIPSWAQPGMATVCACVFSDSPKNGGTPYAEEKIATFEIKSNPEIAYSAPLVANPQTPNGTFETSFRLSPIAEPGNYQVDASARSTLTNGTVQSLLTVQNASSFSVVYTPTPPQAAFTYYPADSYVNMSITFDASASTAEGYNVTIANYEWDFGDGSSEVDTSNPLITHTYPLVESYSVTLNVTDSQGLWCTTSKLITILPPSGPEANFTWSPLKPRPNETATFDATGTVLGWNGTGHPAIVNYVWDFGDSNTTSGYYPTIAHTFTAAGNYTIMLNVTDGSGFEGSVAYTVTVQNSTLVGDINGDGTVNILDSILLANAFNSVPGDLNWNLNADLNGDGVVNILDAIILANHFLQHYP